METSNASSLWRARRFLAGAPAAAGLLLSFALGGDSTVSRRAGFGVQSRWHVGVLAISRATQSELTQSANSLGNNLGGGTRCEKSFLPLCIFLPQQWP
jgi:hypothetical protein